MSASVTKKGSRHVKSIRSSKPEAHDKLPRKVKRGHVWRQRKTQRSHSWACAAKLQTINRTGDSNAVPEKVPAVLPRCYALLFGAPLSFTQDVAEVPGAPPFPGRVSVTGR